MNRRGFLKALGRGLGAVVAAPYLPALDWKWVRHARAYGMGEKKIYARVVLSGSAITSSPGAFCQALDAEMARLARDMSRQMERELWNDVHS